MRFRHYVRFSGFASKQIPLPENYPKIPLNPLSEKENKASHLIDYEVGVTPVALGLISGRINGISLAEPFRNEMAELDGRIRRNPIKDS